LADFPLPLLGFAAYSGTGKTTLLCKLIPLLKDKGYRMGIIKHTHHNIDIDKPGKDSFELRESGASQIVIASRNRTATIIDRPFKKTEPLLTDVLTNLQTDILDFVLVEGFKHANLAKIELHRNALGKPYIYPDDPNIIAIATDHEIDDKNAPTKLDLNQPQQIVEFIERRILKSTPI
jgi:molybdopterin-guanine dinucleotide biosynthesis protein MobB